MAGAERGDASAEALADEQLPPSGRTARLRRVGPGVVLAAAGIGAGDLVAGLIGGSRLGLIAAAAVLIGAVMKYYLVEGVGRWHLATGTTLFAGWRSLGRVPVIYFAVYVVVWTFVVGAAIPTSAALGLNALMPAIPVGWWAVINGVTGFVLVWLGHYRYFELVVKVLVGLMFLTVVGCAVAAVATSPEAVTNAENLVGDGSLFYVLGIIGGIGGTVTLASYGYWLKEKRWSGVAWLPAVRTDVATAYVITSVFAISMVILGVVFGNGFDLLDGDKGVIQLAGALGETLGSVPRILFLIGFWAASFMAFLGALQGVPYLFADFVSTVRGSGDTLRHTQTKDKSLAYRGFLVWMVFPPMILHVLDTPVLLVVAFTVVGAFFMPFLGCTLLLLLNSRRVSADHRNKMRSNVAMVLGLALFATLAVREIISALTQ